MKKSALLVGIDNYLLSSERNLGLRGCVNDVRDFATTLILCRFRPDMIRILINEGATNAKIVENLDSIVRN